MSDPRHLSSGLRWLLLPIGCISGCAALLAATPPSLQGRWEVIQVAVDHQDQPHWLYSPDDPRLLGRELLINDSTISLNDDSRDCLKPMYSPLPAGSLQRFVGQQFSRPQAFKTPPHPKLADFSLKFPDSAVSPMRIGCTPDNSSWKGAWFIALAPDRLLTNYDNNGYVLVLRRRASTDPIKPTFACSKAHGEAEQTICTSAALAGYDRSVAAAYRHALGLSGDDSGSLKQEQIGWLKTRNACAADADCLTKSMHDRVDQLMQP
ncbi:MAG: lysozyme inhibitor LprI family protein [Rhodanobacter sp.]